MSYSGTNLGDGAIQAAILENLSKRLEGAEFYGINLSPREMQRRHGIPAFPITGLAVEFYSSHQALFGEDQHRPSQQRESTGWDRTVQRLRDRAKRIPLLGSGLRFAGQRLRAARNLWRELRHLIPSYLFLRRLDLLVVSGSGQLMELWGGPWGHPYSLFRWALMTKLAKTKFVVASVGITGSVTAPLSRYFLRTALATACYRSYRDQGTKQLLKSWRFTHRDPCVPDLAFSLDLSPYNRTDKRETPRRVVGLGPVSYGNPEHWPANDLVTYGRYLDALTDFASWLIQRGYSVLLFVSSSADRAALGELKDRLRKRYGQAALTHLLEPSINRVEELISQLSSTEFVVATRFHGVTLSHLLLKPVLAIAYDRKVDAHMKDLEQAPYNLDIRRVDARQLCESFASLEANAAQVQSHISKRISAFRVPLDDQYERLVRYATTPSQ